MKTAQPAGYAREAAPAPQCRDRTDCDCAALRAQLIARGLIRETGDESGATRIPASTARVLGLDDAGKVAAEKHLRGPRWLYTPRLRSEDEE